MHSQTPLNLPKAVRFGRELCGDLKAAERREWWLTNGLGGYASGTVAGSLTRRYHGLLVAPLFRPLGQILVGVKADATLTVGAENQPLFTNRWADDIVEPRGHLNIDSFRLQGRMPVWRYGVNGQILESCLWMDHGRNCTWVAYRLLTARPGETANLNICILVNFRGHHGVTTGHDLDVHAQQIADQQLRIDLPQDHMLNMRVYGGQINYDPAWVDNFHLPAEHERGLERNDNHLQIARARLALDTDGWVGFNLAADDDVVTALDDSRSAFLSREQGLLSKAQRALGPQSRMPDWLAQLVLATDSFLFDRRLSDDDRGTSVIAGYPWFGDWGRDTMIALPGLALATGRATIAKRILTTFARFVDRGMLPNRFPGDGELPDYNTVDAALWYVEAWRAYIDASGDIATLDRYFPVLRQIVQQYRHGTRHGIRMDPADNLITCGAPGTQLTWMDAKVGDWVVTPRQGKPVEINALWYNALRSMSDFAQRVNAGDNDYADLADAVKTGFNRFRRDTGASLFDVLDGPSGNDARIRPNQIFAVSLPDSPLPDGRHWEVVETCRGKLLTPFGLRSLAPTHPDYHGIYGGDRRTRDGAYHQGTVWGWLLGPFALALHRTTGDVELARSLLSPMQAHLNEFGLGGIAEIFDGDPPHSPRGCPWQAWSVAETLRAWRQLEG